MRGIGPSGQLLFTGFQPNYLFGLDDLCQKFVGPETRVLEIGVNHGVSTRLFSYYAKHVTAVDKRLTARMEQLEAKSNNITFIESFSQDYLKTLRKGQFDLVYLDGHHGYDTVMKELDIVTRKLKRGYVLAGHDMYPSASPSSQVQMAVSTFFPGIHTGKTILHRFSDSSWAIEM